MQIMESQILHMFRILLRFHLMQNLALETIIVISTGCQIQPLGKIIGTFKGIGLAQMMEYMQLWD